MRSARSRSMLQIKPSALSLKPYCMNAAGLIFDFDGLLVDTEVSIYRAWQANYAAYDQELPLEIYTGCVGSDFSGFDPKAYLDSLLPEGETADWEHWDVERERINQESVNQLGPMPGVVALLEKAKALGIPCAVASSSPDWWVKPHLERMGLEGYFQAIRTRDDVEKIKPAPDLFLSAAEALGASPAECLVFEDSVNGLKAAQAAGIPCIAVPNLITRELDFTGAAKVLKSLVIAGEELLMVNGG
ncbi:MAG: HAD family hydrolase [Verrucomicrobiota bacterium]